MSDPTTEEVRESYQLTGDGLDSKRRQFERAGEFDRWLQGIINTAYNEGCEAKTAVSYSLTVDDAYRAFCEARKGSPLVPGEYEAVFSRVEYAWISAAIKGGVHS